MVVDIERLCERWLPTANDSVLWLLLADVCGVPGPPLPPAPLTKAARCSVTKNGRRE